MKDYNILKKKYGENFAKLCRSLFPTLMEKEGFLSDLILQKFNPSHQLYEDIVNNSLQNKFKDYIYSFVNQENTEKQSINETSEELFDKAGYTLYKCKTNKDVQSFKKYWASDEALCTFRDPDRINTNTIFFAVKKDVEQIKREDFTNPKRQDLYGTSVISLQFTKGESSMLSIKNRYNHAVANPDATFSNDLENIYPGLTESFEKYYGINLKFKNMRNLELPGYVVTSAGKYYKYNMEIDNKYFCPNNIVIKQTFVGINENGEQLTDTVAIQYNKSQYEVIEHFLIDKKNKIISNLIFQMDAFIKSIGKIEKIDIVNVENNERLITIVNDKNETTLLTVNQNNCIVKYENNSIRTIENNFLPNNQHLREFHAKNLENIRSNFNYKNKNLEIFDVPKLRFVGPNALAKNLKLKEINLPSIVCLDYCFAAANEIASVFNAPNVEVIGDGCLRENLKIEQIVLNKVKKIGTNFLLFNNKLKVFKAENLEDIGYNFLRVNENQIDFYAPKLKKFRSGSFKNNISIQNKIKKLNLDNDEIL